MLFSTVRVLSSASMLALLAACGGGGGGGSPNSVSLSGTAGKGLLISADVKAYEIIGGKQSTTPWASTTTSNVGAYELKGSPSSNPIVVVVTTNSNTKMLDESQPQSDGTFKQIAAPLDLKLRSFIETLTQNDTVQVNSLTESAVALANSAKNSSGSTIGLTKESLLAAKQFAQQMAPDGVNPFTASLPAKTSDLNDDKVAKMGVMMAGLMTSVTTDCSVQCQVEKLSKDVPMTISSDGKGSITDAQAAAIQTQKLALLTAGQTVLASKSTELGTLATTVNSIASTTIAAATSSSVGSSTATASTYETVNSVQGFVRTLRESLKTSETKLKSAQTALETKYQKLTIQGLENLSGIVNTVANDCINNKTTFSCSASTGSNTTWVASGAGWQGTGKTSAGYTISGFVSGTLGTNSINASISNVTIKLGDKTVAELQKLDVSGVRTMSGEVETSGNLQLGGTVKAYDTTVGSDIAVTLGLSNVDARFDNTAKTFSMKGTLSLTSNKNDSLNGSVDISGVNRTLTETWGSYSYTRTDHFVNKAALDLKASENSVGEILALSVNGTRTLADLTKAESTTNFETFSLTAGVTLAANTKVTVSAQRPTQTTLKQSVVLQSGSTSKLSLNGDYAQATYSPNKWCSEESGIMMCTDSLSLSANDGTYTAVVKKSASAVTADLYKGSVSSGTKIGVITTQGMIQVTENGTTKEYSLY